MRRQTTCATKQSSPLTRYTERTSGLAASCFSTSASRLARDRAVERQPDLRAHVETEGGGVDDRVVAADHAAPLQLTQALGDGLAREPQLLGQRRSRAPAVAREREQQPAGGAVERRARAAADGRRGDDMSTISPLVSAFVKIRILIH